MQIFLTTLNPGTYTFNDLGAFSVTDPVTDLPLLEPTGEFTLEDIQDSIDLWDEVTAGNIQLTNANGTSLADPSDSESVTFQDLDDRVLEIPLDVSDPTGIRDRAETDLSFDSGTRTLTLARTGSEFVYYIKGRKHTITTDLTLQIPDTTGEYFVYLDDDETLKFFTSFTSDFFFDFSFICILRWTQPIQHLCLLLDERHGISMDGATHRHVHEAFGTKYYGGFDATTATDTISLTGGTIADEDIIIDIVDGAGAGQFEQVLSPQAVLPIIYRLGTNEWRTDTASTLFVQRSGGIPQYNLNTGGSYSLADIPDLDYCAYWILATADVRSPIVSVAGNYVGSSLDDVKLNGNYEALELETISPEFKILYRVLIQRDDTETNNYLIVEAENYRGIVDRRLKAGAKVPVTDHGELIGLLDDDHPQYLNQTRGNAIYYTQAQVDSLIAGVVQNASSAAVQARRTTSIIDISNGWTDLEFDATDVELDDTIIEHDDVNRDDIVVKEDGAYLIAVNIDFFKYFEIRIRVNDSIVVPGSFRQSQANDEGVITTAVIYNATANDKFTVQIQDDNTGPGNLDPDATFIIYKIDGVAGPPGADGADGADGATGPAGAAGPTGFGVYAWAALTGTTGVENAGIGLSASRTGTGSYSYTFDTPVTDTNYAVNVQTYDLTTNTDTNAYVDNRTLSGFDVTIGTGDNGTAADVLVDADHTVLVIGPGSGAPSGSNSIQVWNDGAPVAGGPFTTVDFSDEFVGADAGSSRATIALANPPITSAIRVTSQAVDQATNYNITVVTTALVLTGGVTTIGAGATDFTNTNGTITTNFNGSVKVSYHVPHTSTGTRASLQSGIEQDTGGGFAAVSPIAYSYIRNGTGHNKDDNMGTDIFTCSVGDQFRIGLRRSVNSTQGAAINILPDTIIILERLT